MMMQVDTSLTGLVPSLCRVEQGFDIQGALDWMERYWSLSVFFSLVYVVFVFAGRRWMADRSAYNLRKCLILWNTGLAIFSVFGATASVPNIIANIYQHGVSYTTCHTDCISNSHKRLAIWGWLFALSKIIEFGDTAFIVLRKTPLPFLHWYHHISVCVFTWYALTPSPSALSLWFGGMNYTVHSVMYSYYALRVSGFKFHPWIPRCVTVLQLSQMFLGIFVNLLSWNMARTGQPCMFRYDLFYLSVGMYGSYAILFSNFFYQRYIKNSPRKLATAKVHPETIQASEQLHSNGNHVGNGGMAWKSNGYQFKEGVKLKQY